MKRLELGLILVSFQGNRANAEILFHPTPFNRSQSKGRREQEAKASSFLMKEMEGRSADYNVGGSDRTKILTACI